jgi:hypothetical protein
LQLSLPGSENLDAALGAVLHALPGATRLRTLHAAGLNLSGAFVTERLMPALRANNSLRELRLEPAASMPPEALQAVELVATRSMGSR